MYTDKYGFPLGKLLSPYIESGKVERVLTYMVGRGKRVSYAIMGIKSIRYNEHWYHERWTFVWNSPKRFLN